MDAGHVEKENRILALEKGSKKGTRPSKQYEFCSYPLDKSFHHLGLSEWLGRVVSVVRVIHVVRVIRVVRVVRVVRMVMVVQVFQVFQVVFMV